MRHTPAVLRWVAVVERSTRRSLDQLHTSLVTTHSRPSSASHAILVCPAPPAPPWPAMPTLCPHRSASVDDQLEPLSALVRTAGGTPRDVLLAYPGLAVVPVAHLKGTCHVLRQLGVAGAGAGRPGWRLA